MCVVWTEAPDRERRGVAWSGASPVLLSRRVAAEGGRRSASTGAEATRVAAIRSARAGTGEAGGTLCSLLGLALFVCMRMHLFFAVSCLRPYIYVHTSTCTHVSMYRSLFTYVHVSMYISMCVDNLCCMWTYMLIPSV